MLLFESVGIVSLGQSDNTAAAVPLRCICLVEGGSYSFFMPINNARRLHQQALQEELQRILPCQHRLYYQSLPILPNRLNQDQEEYC
jgi:hypothetical protein